ncbi:MAG: hypothetical protein ACFFBP_06785 [Promethearchaeota archaeon]
MIRKNACPECNGHLIENSYECICSTCGLVVEEILSDSSYKVNNINEKGNLSKQYVALGDRTDHVGGLGSYIDFDGSKYLKDTSGKLLDPNKQRLFKRLKKNYAYFLRIKDHETEYRIFNILNSISQYLNLTTIIRNNAAYFYRKILKNEKKIINNISLIAFCIFYAARKENHNAPITINEIAKAFQSFGHRVSARLILRDGLTYKHHISSRSTPHKSEAYLNRLINETTNHNDLPERMKKKQISWTIDEYKVILTKKCREILSKLSTWKRGGRNPFILMGAVIYLADRLIAKEYDQKIILTQRMISQGTKIAEYSIRDHYVKVLKPMFIDIKN